MPYCKYCGSAVDRDAVFCAECGKRLAPKAPPAPAAPRDTSTVEPVTKRGEAMTIEELMKPNPEKVQAYMERVTGYTLAMTVLN